MNLEEFYAKLDEIRDKYDWFLDLDTIRCKPKGMENPVMCPLTVVCQENMGKFFDRENFGLAGFALKISPYIFYDIAGAADDLPLGRPEPLIIREKMLDILQLKG